MVEYTYEPFGGLASMTGSLKDAVGVSNPIRYRSYYFDDDMGFYYLNSRYYDPVTGRFINADGLIDVRGISTQNMYQYCGNNPVIYADSSGKLFGLIALGLLAVGVVVGLSGCASSSTPAPTQNSSASTSSQAPISSAPISSTPPPSPPTPKEPVWPTPGNNTVTSKFGPRNTGIPGASKNHKGIDIGAPKGAPVVAAFSGKITIPAYSNSAGNYVIISNDQYETRYLHLSKITWDVETMGAYVTAGQKIGEVGNTGVGSGPHLHFDVKENGKWIDPQILFPY